MEIAETQNLLPKSLVKATCTVALRYPLAQEKHWRSARVLKTASKKALMLSKPLGEVIRKGIRGSQTTKTTQAPCTTHLQPLLPLSRP